VVCPSHLNPSPFSYSLLQQSYSQKNPPSKGEHQDALCPQTQRPPTLPPPFCREYKKVQHFCCRPVPVRCSIFSTFSKGFLGFRIGLPLTLETLESPPIARKNASSPSFSYFIANFLFHLSGYESLDQFCCVFVPDEA